ncbi:MAG: TIGR03086 family protein [Streptosporangiales bacterium]|nr:TIGR03086 family protein [Streptosporangiales bacterium]
MRTVDTDVRELDRRAVLASMEIVSLVQVSDLDRPTPCAEWTLGELLAHMTAQHHGFVAAASGEGGDLARWQVTPGVSDPVSAYTLATARVVSAFAAVGVLDRDFSLPELSTQLTFPGRQAIGFHFLDYVVHAWDVTRTLDVPLDLDDDVLATALAMAQDVPDGNLRLRPGAVFGPGVPVAVDASTLDTTVAMLGRSPSWPD